MEVKLKSIEMWNFKGEQHRLTTFNENGTTQICGKNGSGKSRHFTAFVWCLFGKDEYDRKDYEIRTYGSEGNITHEVDSSVEVVLLVDGKETIIKRTYVEDWLKPTGAAERIFKGNHTDYYWQGMPVRAAEYKNNVTTLCEDSLFKALTNPTYFCSLKWDAQRALLFDIVGSITDEAIIKAEPELRTIVDMIDVSSLESVKKKIYTDKKTINSELSEIQPRIDQTYSLIQELDLEDDEITDKIAELDAKIKPVYDAILTKNKNLRTNSAERMALDKKFNEVSNKLTAVIVAASEAHNKKLADVDWQIREHKNIIDAVAERLSHYKMQYYNIEKEQFVRSECPTCHRPYTEEQLEPLRKEWYNNHNSKLNEIVESAKEEKEKAAKSKELLAALQAKRTEIENEPTRESQEYKDLVTERDNIQRQMNAISIPTTDDELAALNTTYNKLIREKEELNNVYNISKTNQRCRNAIEELKLHGKELAQKLSEVEYMEHLLKRYIKAKVGAIEEGINAKFQHVKFRLFGYTIEGNEYEICEATLGGVPYGSLNTASKLLVGLDIINTLCAHYDKYMPIFVDNVEGINNVPETKSQQVHLVVTKTALTIK